MQIYLRPGSNIIDKIIQRQRAQGGLRLAGHMDVDARRWYACKEADQYINRNALTRALCGHRA